LQRLLAALIALLLLPSAPALAHPHIFINAQATIVFDDNGAVSGIRHRWTFDEAFSVWQVQGLDVDNDGMTTPEEMQELAEENLAGLAEYQFYTFAGEGSESLEFAGGRSPRFEYADGQSTLSFEVLLAAPYAIQDTLELAISDPEYYVAIDFADASDVTLENAPAGCGVTLRPEREMPEELAEQLSLLPPEVTELPPHLATALREVRGGIYVACSSGAAPAVPESAVEAAGQMAMAASPQPFGGPPSEPGFVLPRTGLLGWVAEQQRNFYQALTEALGQLRSDGNAFWVLGTLSFLYGVFHAAGPGHGKVVISTYVLANEREVRRGVALSFAAAMLQSAVAVALVLVAVAVLELTSAAMGRLAGWIGVASYGMVALLGLWLILRKLFGWGHAHGPAPGRDLAQRARAQLGLDQAHAGHGGEGHHHSHDHGHHDHEHHHHLVTPKQVQGGWREQLGVVLAVGLRPCSGALVVLVFALSQSLLPAGVAAVLLMGLGTGITVAVLATMALTIKGFAGRYAGAGAGGVAVAVWWAELAAAGLVFGFGVLLLLASLG
jgi:nickel/cobalt exporter